MTVPSGPRHRALVLLGVIIMGVVALALAIGDSLLEFISTKTVDIHFQGVLHSRYSIKRWGSRPTTEPHTRLVAAGSGRIRFVVRAFSYKNLLLVAPGELHGKSTWFWENGLKRLETYWKDHKQQQVWTLWNPNGKILHQWRFKDGEVVEQRPTGPWLNQVKNQKPI